MDRTRLTSRVGTTFGNLRLPLQLSQTALRLSRGAGGVDRATTWDIHGRTEAVSVSASHTQGVVQAEHANFAHLALSIYPYSDGGKDLRMWAALSKISSLPIPASSYIAKMLSSGVSGGMV